jgi:hypothetical protein
VESSGTQQVAKLLLGTLLHRRDDQLAPFSSGEFFAQHIPGARFIPLQGNIHFPWLGDWRSVVTPVLEFLLGDDCSGR